MTLTTTLAEIRIHGPCADGFAKIRNHFGVSPEDAKTHDKNFPVALLLETNDLWDALWVFGRVAPQSMKDDFLIRRLDTGEYSALKSLRENKVDVDWWHGCETAIVNVVDLLKRRKAGGDAIQEMSAAYAATRAADVAYAAASSGRTSVMVPAAETAYAASVAARAADAAAEAAYAPYVAARAADVAAYDAARAAVGRVIAAARATRAAAEHDLKEVIK